MAVTTDAPAPRPWYKIWWKLILAIVFWPFFLTFKVFKSHMRFLPKISAVIGVWLGWFVLTSAWASTEPITPVPLQTKSVEQTQIVGEVADQPNMDIPATVAVASLAPTATSTPTPVPTASPVPTSQPTLKPTPKPTLVPRPTSVVIVQPKPTAANGYPCNCSKTCPNMSSCAEAQYLLNVCGCSARDADHDGIACDADCQ